MRITQAIIRNFRSIDSLEMIFDSKSTVLVGKNDSGKTNLLLALEALDRRFKYGPEDLPYGSKLRNEYNPSNPGRVEMLTIRFRLSAGDVLPTSALNQWAKQGNELQVTKLLDNTYRLDSKISLSGEAGLEMFKQELSELKSDLQSLTDKYPRVERWYEYARAPTFVGYAFDSVVYEITKKLEEIPGPLLRDPAITDRVNTGVSSLRELSAFITNQQATKDIQARILSTIPLYSVYMGGTQNLPGSMKVENLKELPDGNALSRLLDLCKLNLKAYMRTQDDMAKKSLVDQANKTLNKELEALWGILGIKGIRIEFMDGEMKLFVIESSLADSKLEDKSNGFQSLLSFYVQLLHESEQVASAVFLIDEPTVHLHPEWQKKLRALLEQFSERHQIILSTHSTSLIDLTRLDRVRLILRDEGDKTVLKEKFHVSTFDSLEPIRSGLGIDLSDSLFVGSKTLIVEGPEDYYIIQGMSELCRRLGKNHLDFSEVFILADGGSKVPYFAAVASRVSPRCMVLLDADTGHEIKERMVEKWDFDAGHVLLTDTIRKGAYKTSDFLTKRFYDQVLRNCAGDKLKTAKEIFRICHEQDTAKTKLLVGPQSVRNFSDLFQNINNLFC